MAGPQSVSAGWPQHGVVGSPEALTQALPTTDARGAAGVSQTITHLRDYASRGRTPSPLNALGSLQPQAPTAQRALSPRSQPRNGDPAARLAGALERRPSGEHGQHHRKASIVNGLAHHSRNSSLNNPSAMSTRSPQEVSNGLGYGKMSLDASTNSLSSIDAALDPFAESASSTAHGSLRSYASVSTLSGDRNLADDPAAMLTQKRVDRVQNGRARREHSRSHSNKHHQSEHRSVGEYALHHLFNSFVGQADAKINRCVMEISGPELRIEDVCGAGADPEFDQLISALGHIARPRPKSLIDTVMYWRKAKGDAANAAKVEVQQSRAQTIIPRGLPRRNTEPAHILYPENKVVNYETKLAAAPNAESLQEMAIQADRKSSLSIYLLCRVLIEIYSQSDIRSITVQVAEKLEEIIFDQLQRTEPENLSYMPYRLANWHIFGQLLGVMSSLNFVGVSNRFLNELNQFSKELRARGAASKENEERVELIILAMKRLRVRVYPEQPWFDTCAFMCVLGDFFVDSHGLLIKHACCSVLEALVLPIAASATQQLNTPRWKEFISHVNSRLPQMLTKPRHWLDAFPLSTLLLCASPAENFASQWLSVVTSLQAKLKDRLTRSCALQAICRLVWTYLHRITEPKSSVMRKLEDVVKMVLPSGKKPYLSTDPAFAEPIIELIRIIGFRFQDFCFRAITFPLINSDLFASGRDIKVEQLEPDRTVIGIRAFLMVMTDLENAEHGPPPFPKFEYSGYMNDPAYDAKPSIVAKPAGYSRADSKVREDKASRSVQTLKLDDVSREYYARFCEILGKITLICDNAFGGQAALDEKFSSQTPKTPISDSFSFGRKEEHGPAVDHRQGYYDLFHVAVQAVPRCLSPHIPFNSLINLLCTGTAHVHTNIASSSANSLKSIARQSHSQQVTIGFARFIFNYNVRYSTMSDEGMLGPGHIDNTLKLYVELLEIWIEEIRRKTKTKVTSYESHDSPLTGRGLPLDLTSVSGHVDEVESHGVFFLCSQSRRVRSFAVAVLQRVREFDVALGKENSRIIHILEGDVLDVIDPGDDRLSVAERSRLQKGKQKSALQNTLIELCSSEDSYDSTLWFKIFPNLIRMSFESCPLAVTLGRDLVCGRLQHMHNVISGLADSPRLPQSSPYETAIARPFPRLISASTEVLIEQWKLYLVMACTTLTNAGAQTKSQLEVLNNQHSRTKSKSQSQGNDKITSARALFAYVIPLLSAAPNSIREAIVTALGSINSVLYRTLLESLQYAVTTCSEEAKMRTGHQRTNSGARRNRRTDRLRTEVTHVYKLTSRFLHEKEVLREEWILNNLIKYTDEMRFFLSDAEVQNDFEFQTLRRHYCGLIEEVYEGIGRTKDPSKWMSFEARKATFALMEDWCGYSPDQNQISLREERMKQSAIDQNQDSGERTTVTVNFEKEKGNLKVAALSAMASLCGGPLNISFDRGRVTTAFDVRRILQWIDQIFDTSTDRLHVIGRRALTNLIIHNKNNPKLLEHAIDMCYVTHRPKALESYFDVTSQVLIEHNDYPLAFWRILGAVIVTLGNDKDLLRTKSTKLLRIMETRQQKSSKLQDFDIRISDKTVVVYKTAQFEISQRLAAQHSELAFFILSQFSKHFNDAHPDSRRNMIAAILPWIQSVELKIDPSGSPTAQSHMLLANLLEITIKFSNALQNEIQALWQALATGPYSGNVQVTVDFIINLFLVRREQSFIKYAKQIVVYLSITQAGEKVVDFLLMQINPKNMVHPEKPKPLEIPPDLVGLPYVADLGGLLQVGNKQSFFSLGQLSLVLLVDLMVAPVKLASSNVPLLLHVCTIMWDHYTPLVEEHAREMLIHLLHELVISRLDDNRTNPARDSMEKFVECIRQQDSTVVWAYHEYNGKDDEDDGNRVPSSMTTVTTELINFFTLTYPDIHEQWAKVALSWATTCPVRHVACRSFQVFRCILSSLDQPILADMLARLSNTVADEADDVQTFSMEILTTLKTIIAALEPSDLLKYPQLCWATCACLNTVNECEFIESLGMLDKLLEKVNLSNPTVIKIIADAKPEKWEGPFDGIMPLVYKGLKSANALEKSLAIMNKTVSLPDTKILGDQSRLLYALLANLPRFLHAFDDPRPGGEVMAAAQTLAVVAESEDYPEISMVMNAFVNLRYPLAKDFLSQLVSTIRQSFFPTYELKSLIFLMGLLTNRLPWYKLKTMQILCVIIPDIDMRRPDVAIYGPDLISPLLRLLQTEYCPYALEVMDHILTVSATPMDKQHLRMSMVSSGSRAVRKEYERTQSLYGIPEDTGWSIPMPAVHSNLTRLNVHAVFYTCASKEGPAPPVVTPEIEFDNEEYQQGTYFPIERSNTMMSEDTQADMNFEGNMEDLEARLDSLDDFFEDTLSPHSKYLSSYSDVTITDYKPDPDRDADLYDQQTAPILNKSLARTTSMSSLHSTFQDSRQTTAIPTTAIAPPQNSYTMGPTPAPQQRPMLHSRSITSPSPNDAFPRFRPTADLTSDDELTEEILSDDEGRQSSTQTQHHIDLQNYSFSTPSANKPPLHTTLHNPLHTTTSNPSPSSTSHKEPFPPAPAIPHSQSQGQGQPILETMIRRTKSTVRKISNAREFPKRDHLRTARSQSHTPNSPEVPKVPEAYLREVRGEGREGGG